MPFSCDNNILLRTMLTNTNRALTLCNNDKLNINYTRFAYISTGSLIILIMFRLIKVIRVRVISLWIDSLDNVILASKLIIYFFLLYFTWICSTRSHHDNHHTTDIVIYYYDGSTSYTRCNLSRSTNQLVAAKMYLNHTSQYCLGSPSDSYYLFHNLPINIMNNYRYGKSKIAHVKQLCFSFGKLVRSICQQR